MMDVRDWLVTIFGSVTVAIIFFTPLYFVAEAQHKKYLGVCETQNTYTDTEGYVKSCSGLK